MIRLALLLLSLPLAGCESLARRDTVTLEAGDAMASNRAVHVIDPWPLASRNTTIAISGAKIADAVERYELPKPSEGVAPPVGNLTR